jgi:hypothetical protein
LRENALAGGGLFEQQIDVLFGFTQHAEATPAGAGGDEIDQEFELLLMQIADELHRHAVEGCARGFSRFDQRLGFGVELAQEIVAGLDRAERAAIAGDAGEAGGKRARAQWRAGDALAAPAAHSGASPRQRTHRAFAPRDARSGETPPEQPVSESDPERIGAQFVEVAQFRELAAGRGLAAPLIEQHRAHRLPVAARARLVGYVGEGKAQLSRFDAGGGESAAFAQFDVARLCWRERNLQTISLITHGAPQRSFRRRSQVE